MQKAEVVIIGAGLAGLTTAQRLKDDGIECIVVEAGSDIGGRVKQAHGFVPWPVECGPYFVHGRRHSLIFKLIQKEGWPYQVVSWPQLFYLQNERKWIDATGDVEDEDVEMIDEVLHDLVEKGPSSVPRFQTLREYFAQHLPARVRSLAENIYANDVGADGDGVGAAAMAEEEREWIYGEEYVMLRDGDWRRIVETLARGVRTRLNWKATGVDYSRPESITVTSNNGESIECKAVVVTVPITILKQNVIDFSPPLPASKRAAMNVVQMGGGCKIALKFSQPFWDRSTFDVVCGDSFIPEFWMDGGWGRGDPNSTVCTITGFATGVKGDELARLGKEEVTRRFLQQIDDMFENYPGATKGKKIASAHFIDSFFFNWADEEHIGGGYSAPAPGDSGDVRRQLGAPVAGRVFFAGEATNAKLNNCTHGAMETAERAAAEVVAALKGQPQAFRARL